jgi:hypothetical protein
MGAIVGLVGVGGQVYLHCLGGGVQVNYPQQVVPAYT